MRVTLLRSGSGLPGSQRLGPVDTEHTNPAALGSEIEDKIRAIYFFEIPRVLTDTPFDPERYSYQVTVQDGDRIHGVSFTEPSEQARRLGVQALLDLVARWEDVPLEATGPERAAS